MAKRAANKPAKPPTGMADQLRQAIAESGETLYRVAADSGVAYPIVHRFVNGDRDSLKLETFERLANYLGLELRSKTRPKR